MKRILDDEVLERSQPMRIAYREGKLAMIDEVKDFVTLTLSESRLNPFKEVTDFEQGQIAALMAILEACNAAELAVDTKDTADVRFDA